MERDKITLTVVIGGDNERDTEEETEEDEDKDKDKDKDKDGGRGGWETLWSSLQRPSSPPYSSCCLFQPPALFPIT